MRATDWWESARFQTGLCGLELVPAKWRYLVSPTSTPQGYTHRVLRERQPLGRTGSCTEILETS